MIRGILLLLVILAGCESIVLQGDIIGIELTLEIPEETLAGDTEILFCPEDRCGDRLIGLIQDSASVECAFFDLDIPELILALEEKKARVVIDDTNREDFHESGTLTNVRFDRGSRFSHNKFCIIDNQTVWTGSFNPTFNADTKNDNNVIIMHSAFLAYNYQEEFDELWRGDFGKGSRVTYPEINVSGSKVENYFCPDDCKDGPGGEQRLVELIDSAEESIEIAIFSFTLDRVGDALIRAKELGVEITIIIENRNKLGTGSEYQRLLDAGIDIVPDTNPAVMHHKFAIIDGKIVWTGSFNFSNNANKRNDENIVIIHDTKIAELFSLELFRLISNG